MPKVLFCPTIRQGVCLVPFRIVGAIAYSLSKWWGGGGAFCTYVETLECMFIPKAMAISCL